ncbi:hypothetical protein ACFW9D_29295 [Streptomyces sp. NPDC059524]|uniref:hypothetical protein n=1 Tax=Streptomyces sp. NPDC059524 TaxID=3346856 RepID=UPI0036887C22
MSRAISTPAGVQVDGPGHRAVLGHSRSSRRRDGLLVGEQSGDALDDVAHVLAAAVMAGEGAPVLQVANPVFDPDTS